jgi:hypothetical protein
LGGAGRQHSADQKACVLRKRKFIWGFTTTYKTIRKSLRVNKGASHYNSQVNFDSTARNVGKGRKKEKNQIHTIGSNDRHGPLNRKTMHELRHEPRQARVFQHGVFPPPKTLLTLASPQNNVILTINSRSFGM